MVEDYQEEEDDANEITEHSKLNIRYHGERKEEEILIKSLVDLLGCLCSCSTPWTQASL